MNPILLFAFTISLSNVYCESLYKAYVINLAHRPNRLENMSNQLKKYEIPFEAFVAISPADIENERLLRLEGKTSGRFDPETKMTFRLRTKEDKKKIYPTQIGCTQSHLQILLKEAKTNSSAPFLILEDDAVLEKNFYARSIDLIKRIKSPWDILQVGYCYSGRHDCDPFGESGRDYCKIKRTMISCTQGYFVNGSGAAKTIIKSINTPEPDVYDFILGFSTDKYFVSFPKMISQSTAFESDNRAESKQN